MFDFLKRLKNSEDSLQLISGKTSGDIFHDETDGVYLINGKPSYDLAHSCKHDLDVMLQCCDSQMRVMIEQNLVAAPYYFERVAILARKKQDYKLEVSTISAYLKGVRDHYTKNGYEFGEGVMAGPRYIAIEKRLEKAMQLMNSSS